MARVKRAVNAHKKRREVLERASGYRGQRSRLYRKAKEQMLHSLTYAYRDRKKRKADFRQLWITRINAAARENGMTYNRLIQGLKAAGVEVDRKVLADIAGTDAPAFVALVEVARAAAPDSRGATKARRAARVAERRFVVEGPQAVREALDAGGVIELFYEAGRHEDLVDAARAAGAPVTEVSAPVLAAMADTVTPQGPLAIAGLVDVDL